MLSILAEREKEVSNLCDVGWGFADSTPGNSWPWSESRAEGLGTFHPVQTIPANSVCIRHLIPFPTGLCCKGGFLGELSCQSVADQDTHVFIPAPCRLHDFQEPLALWRAPLGYPWESSLAETIALGLRVRGCRNAWIQGSIEGVVRRRAAERSWLGFFHSHAPE